MFVIASGPLEEKLGCFVELHTHTSLRTTEGSAAIPITVFGGGDRHVALLLRNCQLSATHSVIPAIGRRESRRIRKNVHLSLDSRLPIAGMTEWG
ncbi:hypothetical protein ACFL1X_03445 [Candidatus Hydrogenedentota bacterium]